MEPQSTRKSIARAFWGMTATLLALESFSADFDQARLDRLKEHVEELRRKAGIPGITVAVIHGTNTVFTRGFGRHVDEKTPFLVGSISKSFTALAVMQLVEQGKVDLNAPVQRYVPWFRVVDNTGSQITLDHLLHHRSGFSTAEGRKLLGRNPAINGKSAIQSFRTSRLKSLPGEHFQYSNANYVVLGAVIEAVTGLSYSEYVKDNIFGPLGMSHTYASAEGLPTGTLLGHRFWFGKPVEYRKNDVPVGSAPAGGIVSTASDLAKYANALLNDGAYSGRSILSSNYVAQLFARPPESRRERYYAKGWVVNEATIGYPRSIGHGGSTAAFQTDLKLVPDEQVAIVVLMNANSAKRSDLLHVPRAAFDILLGKEPRKAPFVLFDVVVETVFWTFPLFQLGGLIWTLNWLRRWEAHAAVYVTTWTWVRRWWLPLVGHALVAFTCFCGFPGQWMRHCGYFSFSSPILRCSASRSEHSRSFGEQSGVCALLAHCSCDKPCTSHHW